MLDMLVAALLSLFPTYLDNVEAFDNVDAAISAAEATGIDADLLLAMAYVESRFSPYSLSRLECKNKVCKRVTGTWTGDEPPKGAHPTWYCGVLQTGGSISWDECMSMRDLETGYLAGAKHLVEWRNAAPCRKLHEDDRMVCALRGYNGGWAAIKNSAKGYANAVLYRRQVIKKAVANYSNT